MSKSLAGSITATLNFVFQNILDLSTVSDTIRQVPSIAFTNGTGANKAQVAWQDERTLATTATDSLDLTALADNVSFGVTTFTKIKAIMIWVQTTTAGYTLQVGGGAACIDTLFANTSDILKIGAGGLLILVNPDTNGYVVTGTTADILTIYNPSGGNLTYRIMIVGEGSVA